jgi:hypothetical protein
MRYLRLLSVTFLLVFIVTGCHHQPVQVLPPPQTQPPIVTTLPPMPPLTFPDVQLAKPVTEAPPVQAAVPPPTEKQPVKHVHHRRIRRKSAPVQTATATPPPAPPATSVLGQLSSGDATAGQNQAKQTKSLILSIENRLKKLPKSLEENRKTDIEQVETFLSQAKQAWAANDVVGATTLANKAKILLDEITK